MKIKYLVVHCSDTLDDNDFTAEDIHKWHKRNGWSGIGYHYVILRNGMLENGRPEYWKGAHVKRYNHVSLGICLIGKKVFTTRQYGTLELLLEDLISIYPNAKILGHCDLDKKKPYCPGFNVKQWRESNEKVP